MFTIKVFNRKGYTAYACKTFGVVHDKNDGTLIYLNEGAEDKPVERIQVWSEAIVENANGRTIDRIRATPVVTAPLTPDTTYVYCPDKPVVTA
jgi:hypothetical protein